MLGLPQECKLEDALPYFLKFGSVVWVCMGNGFMLLDYEKSESAKKVLNSKHVLKGRRLFIDRREYKEMSKYSKKYFLNTFFTILQCVLIVNIA